MPSHDEVYDPNQNPPLPDFPISNAVERLKVEYEKMKAQRPYQLRQDAEWLYKHKDYVNSIKPDFGKKES